MGERRIAWNGDLVQRRRIEGVRNRLRKRQKDLRNILTRREVDQPGGVLVAHVLDG